MSGIAALAHLDALRSGSVRPHSEDADSHPNPVRQRVIAARDGEYLRRRIESVCVTVVRSCCIR